MSDQNEPRKMTCSNCYTLQDIKHDYCPNCRALLIEPCENPEPDYFGLNEELEEWEDENYEAKFLW